MCVMQQHGVETNSTKGWAVHVDEHGEGWGKGRGAVG